MLITVMYYVQIIFIYLYIMVSERFHYYVCTSTVN